MKLGAIALMALLLAGCGHKKEENLVRELLVDPSSAEFSDVKARGSVVCGFVNSKNAMGGFTGAVPFIVADGIANVADKSPNEQFVKDLIAKCDPSVFDRFSRTFLNKIQIETAAESDVAKH